MKNLIIIAVLFSVSCAKETKLPANSTQESLSFGDTIILTPGLNILFSYELLSDSERLSKVQYQVVSEDSISLKGFQTYINTGKVPATITYESGGLITVTFPHRPLLNGEVVIDLFARTKIAGFRLILTRIETTKRILILDIGSPYYIN